MKAHKINGVSHVLYIGSDITNEDQIPASKFKDDVLQNITGFTFKRDYKLEVTAVVKKDNKRKKRKRIYTFDKGTTLKKAINEALKHRETLLDDLRMEFEHGKADKVLSMPTFEEAFEHYIKAKKLQYASDNKIYNPKMTTQFKDKWLTPILKKRMDEITKTDLQNIMANMKNKKGEPLALRTKKTVSQTVNPVYTWLNEETEFIAKSPASAKTLKLRKLNNERILEINQKETKEIFNELANYTHPIFRAIFMFLLHGRRVNEVLTLEWKDIDFNKKTYTIREENNKARTSMTYVLTDRLISVLKDIEHKKKGFVFSAINDDKKSMNSGTLRNHWKQSIRIHDLRHAIGDYLVNAGTINEVIGAVLGHSPIGNITTRYARVRTETANEALVKMLDDLLGEVHHD